MPLTKCRIKGQPGYKWGSSGTCYPYTPGDAASRNAARAKAERQGRAIEQSKHEESNDG